MATDKTVFNLNSKFTFGKYKGKEVEPIIVKDPSYITWCLDNVEFFDLSDRCKSLLKECKPKKQNSSTHRDSGDGINAVEQGYLDVAGGSGMDGGWGSNPLG